jgi:hypothetical protein
MDTNDLNFNFDLENGGGMFGKMVSTTKNIV